LIDVAEIADIVADEFGLSLEISAPDRRANFPAWQSVSGVVAALAHARGDKVIGISGSQGSGKSTLAEIVCADLEARACKPVVCSLDDFYLTHEARERLARDVHPLLLTRGVPGTHDWQWLENVLQTVQDHGGSVQLPRFDKGLDDRIGSVEATPGMLILEGWCVGVTPQPEQALATACNRLEAEDDEQGIWRNWVNAQITQHYLNLWAHVDLWIHLRVPSFDQVLKWRSLQELQIPAEHRMDSAAIERFIQHYERLTRWMWQQPAMGPGLIIDLDEQHDVSGLKVKNGSQI
jgi:D-glycerate 3-kinase